jgi:hypothetical protein
VTGLIIVLGSYTLLSTINPALVNLVPLKIDPIATISIQEISSELNIGDTVGQTTDASGDVTGDLQRIPVITNVDHNRNLSPQQYSFRPIFMAKFIEAMKELQDKYPQYIVMINSATRTAAEQYGLMMHDYGCPPASSLPKADMTEQEIVAQCPKYGSGGRSGASVSRKNGQLVVRGVSHFGGNAVDMGVSESSGKSSKAGVPCSGQSPEIQKSKGVWNARDYYGANDCVPLAQQHLIGIMLKHGFCVGIKKLDGTKTREAWHFELPDNGMAVYGFCAKANEPYADKDHLPFAFP